MKIMKRMSLVLIVSLVFSCCLSATVFAADIGKFVDVPSDAWYYKELNYATEKGLVNGTSNTTFSPGDTMSRSQVITILWRAFSGKTFSGTKFTDIPRGEWFTSAVYWGVQNKVVNGTGEKTFSPNDNITRQDFATMLGRYITGSGIKLEGSAASVAAFRDAKAVASYARTHVEFMREKGILRGDSAGNVNPLNPVTRAEGVALIARVVAAINKDDLDQWQAGYPDGESGFPEPINPGVYNFYNKKTGQYLSYNGKSLTLSKSPANWNLQSNGMNGFYVYAGDTEYLLDIDNAWIRVGTTIKLWQLTGYDVQIWSVKGNSNGTFSFLYSGDNNYCLGFENGKAQLQIRDGNNSMQEWVAVLNPNVPKDYCSYTSDGGIIELRLPLDISTVISETRLLKWANDLETAYYSFYELTNFKPYNMIVVEAYKPCKYVGYVVTDSNIIHIDRDFLYGDLGKMAARSNDWNFCALHEMGHMFDNRRPWAFEPELMTDLKVAYVMEKNGAGAAPSEFGAAVCFYGKDIINAYDILGSDFSGEYNIFGCCKRFLQIKEKIGWEPFRQTFHQMQKNADYYATASQRVMLDNFIDLLSYYSGKNIKGYFSSAEWNSIRGTLNS